MSISSQKKISNKETISATNLAIGEHVRKLRQKKGWTLSFVSKETEIPISALSKFENAKQSMSYFRLLRLAELYGVEPGQLLDCDATTTPEPRMLGRRSISGNGGVSTIEDDTFMDCFLATDLLNKAMTPIICITRVANIEDWPEWSQHVGEEFIFVLEGQLQFHSEMYAPVQLEAGESIYFDAEVGHAYLTGETDFCRFLSICQSPPKPEAPAKKGRFTTVPVKTDHSRSSTHMIRQRNFTNSCD